ncbi:MAG: glycosyltransferase [Chlorobiales bacterium]|nr:glycosyltransferase [Chlorobiales bacterium]
MKGSDTLGKVRLLAVGHGATSTGFSRVLHGIIAHLPPEYDVRHLAVNHRQDTVLGPWHIWGNPLRGDLYGVERLVELLEHWRPHLILIMGDIWFCTAHAQRLTMVWPRPPLVAYCPVDGKILAPEMVLPLGVFHRVVTYNHFGLAEIARAARQAGSELGNLSIIPHGLDACFFPLYQAKQDPLARSQAKASLWGSALAGPDSFVVLNANKHQPRKRLDLTLEGFALFAQNKPAGVKLYLHTWLEKEGPNLMEIASRLGLKRRLLLTLGAQQGHPNKDDAWLNLLYNACDVGVNTSGGEGWGLVSFEHAATGAPQIVPDHSSCSEIWKGSGILLKAQDIFDHPGLKLRWRFINPLDLAQALEKLYQDRAYMRKMTYSALELAQRPELAWNQVGNQWHELFKEVLYNVTISPFPYKENMQTEISTPRTK